jgi:hypothetical protein
MKLLTTTALFSAVALAPALAQGTQPGQQTQPLGQPQTQTQNQASPQTQAMPQQGELNFVQQQQPGEWSAQWLLNSNVYSRQDDRDLGTINDVIIGSDGNVQAVVIGVGGFLGIGEKNVGVNFDSLEMGPAPAGWTGTARTQAPATGPAATTQQPTGDPATTAQQRDGAVQPQAGDRAQVADAGDARIYLNVTREQLEAAPEYSHREGQEPGMFGGGSAQ